MNRLRFSVLLLAVTSSLFLFLLSEACTKAPAANVSAMALMSQSAPATFSEAALEAMVADYDRFFQDSMGLTETPGAAVVIVKDGQVIFQRGYGVKIAGGQDSVDAHTVFRIGSLSKGFAGVLTGMLVQEGVLNWNEPVQNHYPEFTLSDRSQAQRMELRHLLSHTTGLPHHAYTHLIERGYDIRRIVRNHFPLTPLYGKEGEVFNYQNVAFSAIEEVIQGATYKTYSELLDENIFRPAGMATASTDYKTMQRRSNKALPHLHTRQGWKAVPISPNYYNAVAAGGINASITDMGEWLKLLLGYQPGIVADTTLDRVFQPLINTDKGRPIFPQWIGPEEAFYAMGWRVLEHGGETYVYHGGYVNGFRGELALNRRDGIAVCILFNASTPLGRDCIPAFFERWEKHKYPGLAGKP